MAEIVTLSRVERIPQGSRVYHYDKLPERAKVNLPRLVENGDTSVTVPDRVGAAFEPCDFVKFTDFYRIAVQ